MKGSDPAEALTLNDVMEPLLEDARYLEETGIDVKYISPNDTEVVVNIKGTISVFISDNSADYEMLRVKMSWNTGFVCRRCGASFHEIQDENIPLRPLLGKPQDIEEYNNVIRKINNNEPGALNNQFNVQGECIFTRLSGVTIWNSSPPDAMHDVAEGIIERIIPRFVLKYAIDLQSSEIVSRINEFNFYNGSIKVRYENRAFILKSGTKAVQVGIYTF